MWAELPDLQGSTGAASNLSMLLPEKKWGEKFSALQSLSVSEVVVRPTKYQRYYVLAEVCVPTGCKTKTWSGGLEAFFSFFLQTQKMLLH